MVAAGEAAVNDFILLNARYLLVLDLPDARTRDHAIVALDQSYVVTTLERCCGDNSGDDNFYVAILLVLREALHARKTSTADYTNYADPPGRICVTCG